MRKKKIPTRLCLGCRQMKPKRELIRIVRDKEGNVFIDRTGKRSGRGAYICADNTCLEKARKNNRLEKSLEVKIKDDIFEQLAEELPGNGE
jgi:hypothetical protein